MSVITIIACYVCVFKKSNLEHCITVLSIGYAPKIARETLQLMSIQ